MLVVQERRRNAAPLGNLCIDAFDIRRQVRHVGQLGGGQRVIAFADLPPRERSSPCTKASSRLATVRNHFINGNPSARRARGGGKVGRYLTARKIRAMRELAGSFRSSCAPDQP